MENSICLWYVQNSRILFPYVYGYGVGQIVSSVHLLCIENSHTVTSELSRKRDPKEGVLSKFF